MSLEEFLLNGSDDWWGANDYRGNLIGTSTLSVVIDGESLSGLEVYRANSSLFTFTADPALAEIFDPCITGTPQEGV